MRKSEFTGSQIVAVLQEGEAGVPVANCSASTGSAAQPTTSGRRSMVAPRCPNCAG
jgi:hypothetical protein